MSFSSDTKKQLSQRATVSHCCQRAELMALIRTDGTIAIHGRDGLVLAINTENAAVAGKIYKLSKELFATPGRLLVYKNTRLKKNNRYEIRIPYQEDMKAIFIDLGIMEKDGSWGDLSRNIFPADSLKKDCCKRSYLRGAFLGSGSVNHPDGNYHLEIVNAYRDHAEALQELMAELGIYGKIFKRKNQYVLYLKNANQIGEFLINIGAHQAFLSFESIRVKKDMKNIINRRQNFDLANLDKTVASAMDQEKAIRKIEAEVGLSSLTPALREAARLRLDNPSAPLSELASMANPPVGKSGMNHRLKKLKEIAENL